MEEDTSTIVWPHLKHYQNMQCTDLYWMVKGKPPMAVALGAGTPIGGDKVTWIKLICLN